MLGRLVKTFSLVAVLLIFLAIFAGGLWAVWLWRATPDPSALIRTNPQTTRFLQSYCRDKDCSLDWVPFSQMSDFVPQAVVLAEDIRFFRHPGVDLSSLKAALKRNLSRGRVVWGGSTITQQLAKNLYLGPEKTFGRKAREIVLALKLERSLSKPRILEIYLNVAQWGPSLFGIGKASRHYFDKPAAELGPLEASYLASILPNPEHADEPAWKERFTETGGRLFEALAQTYLPPVHREAEPFACAKPLEESRIAVNDYIVAKIFGAYAHQIVSGQAALLKDAEVLGLLDQKEKAYIEDLFGQARSLGAPPKTDCQRSSPGIDRLVPLSQPSPLYGRGRSGSPKRAGRPWSLS